MTLQYLHDATMVDVIAATAQRAASHDDGRLIVYADDNTRRATAYPQLCQLALQWASWYRQNGVAEGEVVFIGLPSSTEYFAALLGAIASGAIPCTVPLGADAAISVGALNNTIGALRHVEPALFLTSPGVLQALASTALPSATRLVTLDDAVLDDIAPLAKLPRVKGLSPHHLQLTSGSTSAPKAAVLTHDNVIANILAITRAMKINAREDVGCCWLPMFHDMGLMQFLISVFLQLEFVVQTPASFLRNPLRWLQRMSEHRASISAAPAFAFSYCVRRYQTAGAAGLDLSRWRIACVGAERLEYAVFRDFHSRFAAHGFSSSAFFPSYGMAETALAVAMPTRLTPALFEAGAENVEPVPSVGVPVLGMEISVRDAKGEPVKDGCNGEFWLRGTSLMAGYYRDAQRTAEAMQDGWYRTGDIGYVRNGELYVLGRQKELVILRGRNFYPQEFEECVSADPGVGAHRAAAFGVYSARSGTEVLVIVVEPRSYSGLAALRKTLQQRLRAQFGFGADDLVFLPAGGIPRTTSWKPQRKLCAQLYESGELVATRLDEGMTGPREDRLAAVPATPVDALRAAS